MPPSEFIPILEETGLIVPVGTWVLREACRQARAWREKFHDLPPLKVTINVSARQLAQANFRAVVAKALSDTGVDHGQVCLEITEGARHVEDRQELRRRPRGELGRRLGCGLAQGYALSRPLPAADFETLVNRRRNDPFPVGAMSSGAVAIDLGTAERLVTRAPSVETSHQAAAASTQHTVSPVAPVSVPVAEVTEVAGSSASAGAVPVIDEADTAGTVIPAPASTRRRARGTGAPALPRLREFRPARAGATAAPAPLASVPRAPAANDH